MRRAFLISAVALATLATLASCNKEQNAVMKFTATIENADKTNFNINNDGLGVVTWNEGDQVNINNARYNATNISSDGKTAELVYDGGFSDIDAIGYTAVYPADWYKYSNKTLSLPWDHYGTAAGVKAPMCAYSESGTTNLQFKNLCGMVVLKVKSPGKTLDCIYIQTDDGEYITGSFTVNYNNGEPTLTAANHNTVTIQCDGINTPIDDWTYFYFYLPPNNYNVFIITFMDSDGYMCEKFFESGNGHSTFNVERGKYNLLQFDLSSVVWE